MFKVHLLALLLLSVSLLSSCEERITQDEGFGTYGELYEPTKKKSGDADKLSKPVAETPVTIALDNLQGEWMVQKYVLSDISAMSAAQAKQWLNTNASIGTTVFFEYSNIPSMKSAFSDKNSLRLSIEKAESKSVEAIEQAYKVNLKSLGIEAGTTFTAITTNYVQTPFETILQTSDGRLIIVWDGVFFLLDAF